MIKSISVITGLFIITFFTYCGNHSSAPTINTHHSAKYNFGILRYDSAALEYRLDSIHNRGLIFQFCLKEASDNNTAFQLISYAYDTLNDHNNSWMPDTLALIYDSVPKNFQSVVAMGNTEATREILLNTVRDENGQRFSYDYVEFTPVVEGVFRHVVYYLKAVKNGQPTPKGLRQMTSCVPPSRNWN